MSDFLKRLLDAEAARIGETPGRILLIVRPRRESALAQAAHAFGLVLADVLLLIRLNENQRVIRRLHRVGEAACIPLARVLQVALGDPIILLGADADIELK